jgi:hypothetical protein
MDSIERELLREEVGRLRRALDEERHRHVAGIEPAPALAAIFRAHSRAAHRDTVAALRADGDEPLAAAVARLRAERAAAEDEEAWRAAEATATSPGPDGPVDLASAALALRRERDPERRRAFGRAVAEGFRRAAPARERWAEGRARAAAEVGLVPDWEAVVGADALLNGSDDAYRDVLAWLARRELAVAPRGDLDRADLLHLVALARWDGLFPGGMLALALREALAPLGLDLARIRIDEAARPAQWPGAHVAGARVAFRRQGGAADWLDLFDAAGRALATAYRPAGAPADDAFAAAIGALLAGLLLDARFLERRLGADRGVVADLARALALRQLFRLRARAAALRVAAEVERGTAGAAWHEAHREALSLAAGAAWPTGLAARDADAGAHAAALSGAARAARLRTALVERFDEDWWRNPRSAGALAGWLAAGGEETTAAGDRAPLAAGAAALVAVLGG